MAQVIVLIPPVPGGYFEQKSKIDAYRAWLTERGASFTFMGTNVYDTVPYLILIEEVDAVAFKLRFGL